MDLQLSGRLAVVVGGVRGIGRAIASAFLAEQARVIIIDRDPQATSVAQELDPSGRATAYVADVTDIEAVQHVAETIDRTASGCDHLVYAAAIGSGKVGFPFWNVDPADWERVIRVNLLGAVNIAHAFAPAMAKRGSGTLLFLSSVAGQIGSQTDPPYSASKAALINFAQCAARDLAPYGVRVNALCPGMVDTPLTRDVYEAWAARQTPEDRVPYSQWAQDKIRRLVPLGRWQTADEIAAMAVFLASPRAGSVTGQTVNVDGGYVMHW